MMVKKIYLNKKLTNKKDHGLPEKSIILSCFNQSFKIDKLMLNCWIDILNDTHDTYLWLLEDNEISKNNIYSYAEKSGIDKNRIIFAPRVNRTDHLDRLKLSDIIWIQEFIMVIQLQQIRFNAVFQLLH